MRLLDSLGELFKSSITAVAFFQHVIEPRFELLDAFVFAQRISHGSWFCVEVICDIDGKKSKPSDSSLCLSHLKSFIYYLMWDLLILKPRAIVYILSQSSIAC